jgi:hypothetical protein
MEGIEADIRVNRGQTLGHILAYIDFGDLVSYFLKGLGTGGSGPERNLALVRQASHQNGDVLLFLPHGTAPVGWTDSRSGAQRCSRRKTP